jgi:NAD(P)-dependent dehydrogenase (short-subunit alcohol dehydrogenase family)
MFNLKNKTLIITGGAGLVGGAFSKACAEYDANVVITDIDEEKASDEKRNRE